MTQVGLCAASAGEIPRYPCQACSLLCRLQTAWDSSNFIERKWCKAVVAKAAALTRACIHICIACMCTGMHVRNDTYST